MLDNLGSHNGLIEESSITLCRLVSLAGPRDVTSQNTKFLSRKCKQNCDNRIMLNVHAAWRVAIIAGLQQLRFNATLLCVRTKIRGAHHSRWTDVNHI